MKLNRAEKMLLNNPVRAWVQRHYEASLLEHLGGRVEGGYVLEVGCGRGIGSELLLHRFGARYVRALDLDPTMIEQARLQLAAYLPARLQIEVGDVTAIAAPDRSFDAVFDFGMLHHVLGWHVAVAEIRRVLKPGGHFFFEEMTRQALRRWVYRTWLDHPTEYRFSAHDLIAELERQGIIVGTRVVERFSGDLVIGVCRVVAADGESEPPHRLTKRRGRDKIT